MTTDTLFAHLVACFSVHPENLATEALAYLLERGQPGWGALRRHLARTGVELPIDLCFRTQSVAADGGIPDLVGVRSDGECSLILEAKFWAGLTANQPVTYISRLPASGPSILAFVAPALRFTTLANELWRRCHDDGIEISSTIELDAECWYCTLPEGAAFVLISWRQLLDVVVAGLRAHGRAELASDAEQLMGLCRRMDEAAFLPLSSQDLAPDHGRRIRHFCALVNDATSELVAKGLASTKGLRASAKAGWYGRYMRLAGHGCCLSFSADRWARLAETPIWLSVMNRQWHHTEEIRQGLAPLLATRPARLIVDDGRTLLPISLPLGAEKHAVVRRIVEQVVEVHDLLVAAGGGRAEESAPAAGDEPDDPAAFEPDSLESEVDAEGPEPD